MVMICVTQLLAKSRAAGPLADGWPNFAATQRSTNVVVGYVSQPTHGGLAGQIAAALNVRMFGELPKSVTEIIAQHDAGWAELDLPALEQVSGKHPDSFLRVLRAAPSRPGNGQLPPKKRCLPWLSI
jgi:Protein of unknown function (DUF3891)